MKGRNFVMYALQPIIEEIRATGTGGHVEYIGQAA